MSNSNYIQGPFGNGIIPTKYGDFQICVFYNGNEHAIVLHKGSLQDSQGILCRIQSECVEHFFLCTHCDCQDEMDISLSMISKAEKGIIIYLKQEGKGAGIIAKIEKLETDKRNYDIAVQILKRYQINSIKLITNNLHKEQYLRDSGITIDLIPPFGKVIILGEKIQKFVTEITSKKAKPVIFIKEANKKILTIGDLNIDNLISIERNSYGKTDSIPDTTRIGGTGFNAAIAYKNHGFTPIVFGKIGNDTGGDKILEELKSKEIDSFVGIGDKPTGFVNLMYFDERPRTVKYNIENANDYDIDNLEQSLILGDISEKDIIFITSYIFSARNYDLSYCKSFIDKLTRTNAKLILDLVPHDIYAHISLDQLKSCFSDSLYAIIGEFPTFMKFIDKSVITIHDPIAPDFKKVISSFDTKYIICRYGGIGNINYETLYYLQNNTLMYIDDEIKTETHYEDLSPELKRGFGDVLAAKAIIKLLNNDEKMKRNG